MVQRQTRWLGVPKQSYLYVLGNPESPSAKTNHEILGLRAPRLGGMGFGSNAAMHRGECQREQQLVLRRRQPYPLRELRLHG